MNKLNLNLISKNVEKKIYESFKGKKKEAIKLAKKIKDKLQKENKNFLLINLNESEEKKN